MGETQQTTLSQEALIESLLFVASEPTLLTRLANTLDISVASVKQSLQTLEVQYSTRGLRLQWHQNAVQLTTAPEAGQVVERFFGLEVNTRLSPAALETLAIVAHMQPITRPHIDQIRGVNSDGSLRTLLSQALIEEVGRMDTPGRPILYGTTIEFLQHFGLSSLEELSALGEEEE